MTDMQILASVVVAFLTRRAPAPGVVIGVVVSLVGIAGVLVPGLLGDTSGGRVTPVLLLLGLVSITALALGTLAQKRAGAVDLIPAVAVQTLGGALVTGLGVTLCGVGIATLVSRRVEPAAPVGESGRVDPKVGAAAEAPAECTSRR
ncbi:hypothetical protein [Brevibacterium litoralis]|uniref:hypothetical protein n=1 Tax=Brevibacterium litoralis TaxID=3138935 RepID=UPI0032ED9009